ncbi:guanylate-binding protein 2 [Pelomyxa schiedti]|nr:guanylate-binding protein 2 [Pelomyxa schiedti]
MSTRRRTASGLPLVLVALAWSMVVGAAPDIEFINLAPAPAAAATPGPRPSSPSPSGDVAHVGVGPMNHDHDHDHDHEAGAAVGAWTKPVQIIRPNAAHTSLEVLDDNLRMIARQSACDAGVAVISVVGPYHSGKSFLLNQLVEMFGSKASFDIGPTVSPQTLGMWAYIPEKKLDGKTVILIDTEGFFGTGATEEYDAKLFAVSTLMSSLMIYNSIKVIDQSQIDYLDLLSRRTQLFALKKSNSTPDYLTFPHLIWLVRDFIQELDTEPGTWLSQLLIDRSRYTLSNATEAITNSPLSPIENSLENVFSSIECHTLFLPSTTKETLRHLDSVPSDQLTDEFKKDLEILKAIVKNKTPAKANNKKFLQPAELVALLRMLVDAANGGAFPKVPSVWEGFLLYQVDLALRESKYYFEDLSRNILKTHPPLPEREYFEQLNSIKEGTEVFFKTHLLGMDNVYQAKLPILHKELESASSNSRLAYNQKVHEYCHQIKDKHASDLKSTLNAISLPLSEKDLITRQTAEKEATMNSFSRMLAGYDNIVKGLKKELENAVDTLLREHIHENNRQLQNELSSAVSLAVEPYNRAIKLVENASPPISYDDFTLLQKTCKDQSEDIFNQRSKVASGTAWHSTFLQSHRMEQITKEKELSELWSKTLETYVKKCMSEAHVCFRTKTSLQNNPLPVNTEKLFSELTQAKQECLSKFISNTTKFVPSSIVVEGKTQLSAGLEQSLLDITRRNNEIIQERFSRAYETALDSFERKLGSIDLPCDTEALDLDMRSLRHSSMKDYGSASVHSLSESLSRTERAKLEFALEKASEDLRKKNTEILTKQQAAVVGAVIFEMNEQKPHYWFQNSFAKDVKNLLTRKLAARGASPQTTEAIVNNIMGNDANFALFLKEAGSFSSVGSFVLRSLIGITVILVLLKWCTHSKIQYRR